MNHSIEEIQALYKLRWRVELAFKRLKSNLNIEKIYSIHEPNWKQDVQFRVLVDSCIRIHQHSPKTVSPPTLTTQFPIGTNTHRKEQSYRVLMIQLITPTMKSICTCVFPQLIQTIL